MYLTVSKRFEFSASRRLWRADWNAVENFAAFGPESVARFGTGFNFTAYFGFTGPVNKRDGMLINVGTIKARVTTLLKAKFDHKFLNADNTDFSAELPTTGNLARRLWIDAEPLFHDLTARLVVCHLVESPQRSATAYADGRTETHSTIVFSAARQTRSPHLSDKENAQLFGVAAGEHGHEYHLRLTTNSPKAGESAITECLRSIHRELDHKNLNEDVDGLRGMAITTENLARYCFGRAQEFLPVTRVRLHEREDFFAEYNARQQFHLGLQSFFHAAHRLHSPQMSSAENMVLFEKCNNPQGHGHRYLVETTIGGELDERSGTLYNFAKFNHGLCRALAPWEHKHLDQEVPEFRERVSTGENICAALWPRVDAECDGRLSRLRLWETPNNRFTLRRQLNGADA